MKIISENRKAWFNFELSENIEAGIVLLGTEVKSLRDKHVDIKDAFVICKNGEIWLKRCNIPEYKFARAASHDPLRDKKLLLHKRQINKLAGKLKEKTTTMVPIKIYLNKKGIVKMELAIAKGKKQHDKRDKVKKRDLDRQNARDLHK